jgi:nucleotide-binding universal stress UspA family protein
MERITVGYDGSPDADAALDWALDTGERDDASVTALLAWSPGDCPGAVREIAGPSAGAEALEEAGRTVLENAVGRHPHPANGATITTRLVQASPAKAIQDLMADTDLIVLGRHGAGGRRHVFTGSVTAECLHHATVPVAVVAARQTRPDDQRPIVVGVDGSQASLNALRWAAAAARRRQVPLVAVHAWAPVMPAYTGFAAGYYGGVDPEVMVKGARALLDDAVARTLGDSAAVRQRVVDGGAGAALVAASADAQLLVVASRGHGGFATLLLGSTAHQCVQHSRCPVVVHRSRTT